MILGLVLHSLAAVIWVGGMFFAYMVLRKAANALDAPVRLRLWHGVFETFFNWVFASILVLLVTGYWMLFWYLGGFTGAGMHVHLMQATGLVMMALFLHLYFAPWKRMQRAVDLEDYPAAAKQLGQIRWIVMTNLTLGLITVAVGSSGRWWG
jgi:uncharacterized membrane protein